MAQETASYQSVSINSASKQSMEYKYVITMHYNRILQITAFVPSTDHMEFYKERAFCFSVSALESALYPYINPDKEYQKEISVWLNSKDRTADELNPNSVKFRLAQLSFITEFLHRKGLLLEELIVDEINPVWTI